VPAESIQVTGTKEAKPSGKGVTGGFSTNILGGAKQARGGALIDIRTRNIKHLLEYYAVCNGRVGAFLESPITTRRWGCASGIRLSPAEFAFPLISL
jgi:hypothetical protein